MFIVLCDCKKAAAVRRLLSHDFCAVPGALAASLWANSSSGRCLSLSPLSVRLSRQSPSVFSLVLSLSSHSGDRCSHLGRRKRVYQTHIKPANESLRKSNRGQWEVHELAFWPMTIKLQKKWAGRNELRVCCLEYFRVCLRFAPWLVY